MHLLESVLWAMIKKTFNSLGSVVIKKSDLLNFSELNLEGCLYMNLLTHTNFVNSLIVWINFLKVFLQK